MNKVTPAIAATIVVAAAALGAISLPIAPYARSSEAETQNDAPYEAGERELATMLEGRVAGKPVHCLTPSQRRNVKVIDKTAFIFRSGKTIYVNRPSAPRFLRKRDLPIFRTNGSALCRQDWVEMHNRVNNFPGPVFVLQDFIPYTKVEAAPAQKMSEEPKP